MDALAKEFKRMRDYNPNDNHFMGYACHFMNSGQEPSTEWQCIDNALENAPTIDAITVAWIENQIAQHTSENGWTDWWGDMCRRFLQEYERRRDDERLIDANELKKHAGYYRAVTVDSIDAAPTIAAIPMDWMDAQIHGYASRLQSTELKALLIVSRLWEKDQEAR